MTIQFQLVKSKSGHPVDLTPQEVLQMDKLDSWEFLGPEISAQCYALFLQGYSTEAIAKENEMSLGPRAWGLIVKARLDFDWDLERDKYTRELMIAVRQGAEKAVLEGVQFCTDAMTVYHRVLGQRFRNYLQSGNPDDLGDYGKTLSMKNYREFVEIFQALTGQEGGKPPKNALPPATEAPTVTLERTDKAAPIASDDAIALLEALKKVERKRK